ncbi:MAG: DNA-3-methyladenine glycosylase [Treponema sp. GWB1_62_6]|nr:MAG: DNA-3-methyladenine glycosylase [Treponema sp. GWA1_62_8]OHE64841.1 MAG: DNA-3-methyladenine glycosylase [Treponema sp. GWB1_62_6]OHE69560.1 MAG: DNA-3-methyladenine glycosylase [Treponema sp. GWC1_61_84]OHE76829.1 MAG: DNA-3-methyladenine glycosylase [Treponema sp. RIFOXYC1_FULL_61_9]HCM26938.1 DNA-3-methyladenine glycosylase I [Treponema sp.]
MGDSPFRCPWCGMDADYVRYHDEEWGVPLRDDARLFGLLVLEGAQAGLSWLTVLKRRAGYLRAFDGLDPGRMARYGQEDILRLMADGGIVRNRRKIESSVSNARAWLALRTEKGSFSDWLWDFVDGKPVVNAWKSMAEVPAVTPLAERISKELRARGFSFVGPTIVYAYLQSAGLVNDHLADCFRHGEITGRE